MTEKDLSCINIFAEYVTGMQEGKGKKDRKRAGSM
jgi:hypothetical protein